MEQRERAELSDWLSILNSLCIYYIRRELQRERISITFILTFWFTLVNNISLRIVTWGVDC